MVADIGLGANKASDAVYLVWKGIDGNKKYKLQIDDFPDVQQFWSITTYNSSTFLVAGDLGDGTKQISNINGSLKSSCIANRIKGIKVTNNGVKYLNSSQPLDNVLVILSADIPTEDCYWLPLQKDHDATPRAKLNLEMACIITILV